MSNNVKITYLDTELGAEYKTEPTCLLGLTAYRQCRFLSMAPCAATVHDARKSGASRGM
jgi:hypothetical protein